jgi:hypothetical protein
MVVNLKNNNFTAKKLTKRTIRKVILFYYGYIAASSSSIAISNPVSAM